MRFELHVESASQIANRYCRHHVALSPPPCDPFADLWHDEWRPCHHSQSGIVVHIGLPELLSALVVHLDVPKLHMLSFLHKCSQYRNRMRRANCDTTQIFYSAKVLFGKSCKKMP